MIASLILAGVAAIVWIRPSSSSKQMCNLHAEVPLVALFGLVHPLDRGCQCCSWWMRGGDGGGINDAALRGHQALGLQMIDTLC